MSNVVDIFLHLDIYLMQSIQVLGLWIYVVVFFIVFCETGLVFTPFLPGDSLLFALGALTVKDHAPLSLSALFFTLTAAGFFGDSVNYSLGRRCGRWLIDKNVSGRLFKPEYLLKTQKFYDRYGARAVILARFLPIVRTYVPFTAGLGKMSRRQFTAYNFLGSALWVGVILILGHWFGRLPKVKTHFHYVVLAIVVISVLPVVVSFLQKKER